MLWCCVKTEDQGHSVDKEQYTMEKKVYMNA